MIKNRVLYLLLCMSVLFIGSCDDKHAAPDKSVLRYANATARDTLLEVFDRMQRVPFAQVDDTPFQKHISNNSGRPFLMDSDSDIYGMYKTLKETTGFSRIKSEILKDSNYILKNYGSVIALLRGGNLFRQSGNPLAAALYYNDTSGRLYCCNLATDSLSVIDVDDGLVSLGRRFALQRPASYEEIGAEPTPHSIVCVMTRSYSYAIAVCFQFPYAVIDYKTDFGMRDLMSQDQFDRRKLVDTLIYSLFGACNSGATPY